MPFRDRSSSRRRGLQRFNAPATSDIDAEQEYRVGPGRPPANVIFPYHSKLGYSLEGRRIKRLVGVHDLAASGEQILSDGLTA